MDDALRIAFEAGLPFAGLRDALPDGRLRRYIPPGYAREHRMIPVGLDGDVLRVAAATPRADLSRLEAWFPKLRPALSIARGHEIDAALARGTDSAAVSTTAFYRQLASHAGLGFVTLTPSAGDDPDHQGINPLAARLLSEETCRHFTLLPVAYAGGIVTIATSTPADEVAREAATTLTARNVRFVVAPEAELLAAIDGTFGDGPAPVSANKDAASEPNSSDQAELAGHTGGRRLGELLIGRGLASGEQIASGLDSQARSGARLGEILTAEGSLSEVARISVLAEQFQLPLVDLNGYEPDPAAVAVIPEPLARRLHVVPLAVDEATLSLATADRLDGETVAALRAHTRLELRGFLAPRTAIDALMRRIHGPAYVEVSESDLRDRFPESSADRGLSGAQKLVLVLTLSAVVALLILFPMTTTIVIIGACSLFSLAAALSRLRPVHRALGHTAEVDVSDTEVAALDERELPIYTILVPLHQESARLPLLISGLRGLDYPKAKLDVRLLCEEDDPETPAALLELNLPPYFRLVIVPDGHPRTRPRSCNYGLLQAEGPYVVVYDAADRPDPDELKRCVAAFAKAGPRVACVRATANHVVTDRLIALAAWDPFNLAPDVDLGVRLHRAGSTTAVIGASTRKQADAGRIARPKHYTRWTEGTIQTYLAHMRTPFLLFRQLGLKRFVAFQLVIGGAFVPLLIPLFLVLTTVFFLTAAGVIEPLLPKLVLYAAVSQLPVGILVLMSQDVAGAMQRGSRGR